MNEFGLVQRKLNQAKYKLQKFLDMDSTYSDKDMHHTMRKEVNIWLEMEEILWRQRSKAL